MSLTFYFAPMSTASLTDGVLAELGTPHERVQIDLGAGETKRPAFLAINPNGRVPAIVHDGSAIWESSAITMYLGEMFGVEAGLYPAPGPRRGEAMKWIAWGNVTLGEAGGRLSMALPPGHDGAAQPGTQDWVPAGQRVEGAKQKALADIAVCLGILDGALAGRPFLLGDYTLADTHVSGIVGWLGMMQVDTGPFANVAAWMRRCGERPAIAKMMAG